MIVLFDASHNVYSKMFTGKNCTIEHISQRILTTDQWAKILIDLNSVYGLKY